MTAETNPLIRTVRLVDASQRVPWPGAPGRLAPATPFSVSLIDPFWSALLADGTLREVQPAADPPATKPAGAAKPKS